MYLHEIWIEAKFWGGRSYTVLAILHLLDKEAVLVEEAVGSHTTVHQSEKWLEASLLSESHSVVSVMDYAIHGILQARILEWVAFSFSRRSSWPRDRTKVSHIAGRFFTSWATGKHHTSVPFHWLYSSWRHLLVYEFQLQSV